jgi:hypothetical protein
MLHSAVLPGPAPRYTRAMNQNQKQGHSCSKCGAEKTQAIKAYLQASFPDYTISDLHNDKLRGHIFFVDRHDERIHRADVSYPFFREYTPEQITRRLTEWNLATTMREAESARVNVLLKGLEPGQPGSMDT